MFLNSLSPHLCCNDEGEQDVDQMIAWKEGGRLFGLHNHGHDPCGHYHDSS